MTYRKIFHASTGMDGAYTGAPTGSNTTALYRMGDAPNPAPPRIRDKRGVFYLVFYQPNTTTAFDPGFSAGQIILQTRGITSDKVGFAYRTNGVSQRLEFDMATVDAQRGAIVFKDMPIPGIFGWKFKGVKAANNYDWVAYYIL